MYIDFHTHIIPGIDDGAHDVNESIKMLLAAKESGAQTVVLTPHVNSSANYEEFVRVRKEAFDSLKDAMNACDAPLPETLLGAEVLLDDDLSEKEDISPLLIEGTDLLLLELPYTSWNSWFNREIYNIIAKHEVTPVMAHIERYLNTPKDVNRLNTLVSFGVKFQINASSFLSFSGRRIIRELAAEGLIWAIGSDCHNTTRRTADIKRALSAFDKKFGPDFINHIHNKTLRLLEENKLS